MLNQKSRSENIAKNIIGGVGGQIFTSILMFVCRTYFIKLLGATYLGVNGLFSNILSMLSLAELGIGPAIVFSMYKPIAENDEVHIAKLMNFYKDAYRIVGITVALVGAALVPFLDVLIKDTSGVENLRLIFALILSNTVISYFYAYKGSMLNADQKGYVTVIIRNIFSVVQNVAQILILILTHNFILYLIVQIVTTFFANFIQAKYVDKKYPFLVKYKKDKIEQAERRDIMKRVQGMMMHKIGGFVLNSTDNLVISKFVGLVAVGIYSNYYMVINLVKTYVGFFTHGLSASVGNLIASESEQRSYDVFKSVFFVYFWIFAFCFISFWVIFQPFIGVWIGDSLRLDRMTLFIVLLNFYLSGVQECVNTFTNATGLFWEVRHKPIIECVVNLGVSIILAQRFGIVGVFLGTLASYLSVFWVNPIVIFKKQFKRSSAMYFVRMAAYSALAVGIALGLGWGCDIISSAATILNVVFRCLMCVIVPNVIFILLFHRTKEFNYCKGLAGGLVTKFIKRRK